MSTSRIRGALVQNGLGIGLIFVQAVLACSVIALAFAFVLDRADKVAIETGLRETGLVILQVTDTGNPDTRESRLKVEAARLSEAPGVASLALTSHLPMGEGETSFGVCANRQIFEAAVATGSIDRSGCAMPAAYATSPGALQTLGLELIAGRGFVASDFDTDSPKVTVVSVSLGRELYGAGPVVGQVLQAGPDSILTVVGMVADFVRPHPTGDDGDHLVLLTPEWPPGKSAFYITRLRDGHDAMSFMTTAMADFAAVNSRQVADEDGAKTYHDIRRRYFSRDYALIEILAFVVTCLLVVTSVGFFSLTWVWVRIRRKSIGIRRALGARCVDILRMVLIENATITVAGSAVATLLILGAGPWLRELGISNLHIGMALAIGWLATLVLGQVAALVPALRAAKVDPAVATRS